MKTPSLYRWLCSQTLTNFKASLKPPSLFPAKRTELGVGKNNHRVTVLPFWRESLSHLPLLNWSRGKTFPKSLSSLFHHLLPPVLLLPFSRMRDGHMWDKLVKKGNHSNYFSQAHGNGFKGQQSCKSFAANPLLFSAQTLGKETLSYRLAVLFNPAYSL